MIDTGKGSMNGSDRYAPIQWDPEERPSMPGRPSFARHPPARRVAFFLVGALVTLTGGLGNALVTVNLVNLQGAQRHAFAADTTALQLRANFLAAHVDRYRALSAGWTPPPASFSSPSSSSPAR